MCKGLRWDPHTLTRMQACRQWVKKACPSSGESMSSRRSYSPQGFWQISNNHVHPPPSPPYQPYMAHRTTRFQPNSPLFSHL